MNKRINIAIDGYSSCGKGTLAKMLAKELGYLFIDSGAMYRAVTLMMIRKGINSNDTAAVTALLPELDITFKHNPEKNFYHTILNGLGVEEDIRSMEVSEMVSDVSKITEVRSFLVAQQKNLGRNKGVVMDGRDIGTVVFPDAELKIFMTARPEIRAMRRYMELPAEVKSNIQIDEVLRNINSRDLQDASRTNSPLKMADDAVLLDNSELSKDEQLRIALNLVKERL